MRGSAYPGIRKRGNQLYFRYTKADGTREEGAPSGFVVGQEEAAAKVLESIKRRENAEREFAAKAEKTPEDLATTKGVTVRAYAAVWHRRRELTKPQAAKQDRWKLIHILETLGALLLTEFRPRHTRDFVFALKTKRDEQGNLVHAPRTVRSIYSTLHIMMHEAVVDELIPVSPVVVKRGDLPRNEDADLDWRNGAVFGRDEVEQLISDERVPWHHRILYALLFLAGLRPSEAFALRVRQYDATREPLGRLELLRAWNTAEQAEKELKTGKRRLVPVHRTLAKLLGRWLLSGWAEHVGRRPGADDLLIPDEKGEHLGVDDTYVRMLADLDLLGLRKRRQYDSRRTFLSLALGDGASREMLRWVTHGPRGNDVMDLYTSIPWPAICAEVSKLRVDLREGVLVGLRQASGGQNWDSHWDNRESGGEMLSNFRSRHPDLNRRPTDYEGVSGVCVSSGFVGKHRRSLASSEGRSAPPVAICAPTVPLSHAPPPALHDSITLALRDAARQWLEHPDPAALKRDLEAILGALT